MYISELVVRSNATLEASTVIALLNATNFQVTDSTEVFHTVAIEEIALVAGTPGLHSYWMQVSPSSPSSSYTELMILFICFY